MITLGKQGTQEAKSEAWRWMRVGEQLAVVVSSRAYIPTFRSVRWCPRYLARSEIATKNGKAVTLEYSEYRIARETMPQWPLSSWWTTTCLPFAPQGHTPVRVPGLLPAKLLPTKIACDTICATNVQSNLCTPPLADRQT